MKSRQFGLLVTLVVICLSLVGLSQGPPGALVTNQYLNGQQTNGFVRGLIGLNGSNLVSIDPTGAGTTMAGTLAVTGNTTLSGTLNLSGALTNTGGIGASSLTTNLKTGTIPLDLWTARLISGNAIQNTTEAGVPDGNTSPLLQRVNGATDKQVRLQWAAGQSVEIQFPAIVLPADFDTSLSASVKFLAASSGVSDTPVITVYWFSGIGDTDQGGNSGAVTGTTIAAYSRTIAASAANTQLKPVSIAIAAGTHATDALNVYACWVEYTRKS